MVADQGDQANMRLSNSKTKRGRFGGRLCLLLLLSVAALIFLPGKTGAQPAAASKEYQIKAAFLFNFAQFIEWPPNAFTNSEAPLCIGVLGDDPFGKALDETIRGETIRNRRLIIRRSHRVEDLMDCQVVFISKSEKARMADVLSKLNTKETLTVSETDGFARRGGIINFYVEGSKLRFEINPTAAQRRGLKVSSQLLSLGKVVEPEASGADK
jgi:hypothetical protein